MLNSQRVAQRVSCLRAEMWVDSGRDFVDVREITNSRDARWCSCSYRDSAEIVVYVCVCVRSMTNNSSVMWVVVRGVGEMVVLVRMWYASIARVSYSVVRVRGSMCLMSDEWAVVCGCVSDEMGSSSRCCRWVRVCCVMRVLYYPPLQISRWKNEIFMI